MHQVTVGITEGNNVEITSGVSGGMTVVTDGQDKLQEGSLVDARQPNAPASNGGGRSPASGGSGGGKGGRKKT
jgi:hypothetical protein